MTKRIPVIFFEFDGRTYIVAEKIAEYPTDVIMLANGLIVKPTWSPDRKISELNLAKDCEIDAVYADRKTQTWQAMDITEFIRQRR